MGKEGGVVVAMLSFTARVNGAEGLLLFWASWESSASMSSLGTE